MGRHRGRCDHRPLADVEDALDAAPLKSRSNGRQHLLEEIALDDLDEHAVAHAHPIPLADKRRIRIA